jgi:hypothetical protein
MRVLVVSDFHLGAARGHDVLRFPEPRKRLLDAIEQVDQLVLLGDLVELRDGPRAMSAARPILTDIGRHVGPDREVILVPGDHDHALIRPWAEALGLALTIDSTAPADATPALAQIASWLAPSRVRVQYPGVWLPDRVWATHGHYLDAYLTPHILFGLPLQLPGVATRRKVPADYEPVFTSRQDQMAAGAAAARDPTDIARYEPQGVDRALRLVDRAPSSFVTALLTLQLRYAAVPALAHAVASLSVDAATIMFGHVHSRWPLPGDDARPRRRLATAPAMLSAGAWVYDQRIVGSAPPSHPYWPGGALVLESGRPPRAVKLLDDLDLAALMRTSPRDVKPLSRPTVSARG